MTEPIQVPSAGAPETDKSAVRIGPEPWEGEIKSGQLLFIINGSQEASWAFVKRLAMEQLKRMEEARKLRERDERIAALEATLRKRDTLLDKWNEKLDSLRAQIEKLSAPVTELSAVCLEIYELTKTIRNHGCIEKSNPDHSCGDPGAPPCSWTELDIEDYCNNCKVSGAARKARTVAKRRRSMIVRRLAARKGAA